MAIKTQPDREQTLVKGIAEIRLKERMGKLLFSGGSDLTARAALKKK
ncbi:MAG TPA: hypothetical protein VF011_13625 [Terriglobales bacterium]